MSVLSALNELPLDHEDTRREILQIKYAVKHMASSQASQVFSNGEYRYWQRTLLAVGLQVMQQFTGFNIFVQYLGAMFKNQLLFGTRLSLLLAACCSTEFLLASIGVVFVIDRFWGRRDLTIFASSGMCFCMIMLAIFNYLGLEQGDDWAFDVMVAFLFLYLTCKLSPSNRKLHHADSFASLRHRLARHELDVGCRTCTPQHQRPSQRNVNRRKLAEQLHCRPRHPRFVQQHPLADIHCVCRF